VKTSWVGLNLIKRSERCVLHAYLDTGGVPTIGYGHTAAVNMGDKCTQEQADAWLVEDVVDSEKAVEELVHVPLNQNQFDALVDFTFNLGRGHLENSSLLKLLNRGMYGAAAKQFGLWVYDAGHKQPGLVIRRDAERQLFESMPG
jgi:lysozyme